MNTSIRGRTDVPRPPYIAALGVPVKKKAAAAQLGRQGGWKGALPGTGRSLSGKGADLREGTYFPTVPEAFPYCGSPRTNNIQHEKIHTDFKLDNEK